jgi:hypothetical protein
LANFSLADYETVEQRIKRFYGDYPDGRITTENLTTLQDRQVSTWVVKASIYLNTGDQAAGLPKATGMAFEIDGAGMANKTSALENAETSSIGRALANAGYSGNKRTTREEMAKVERGVTPVAPSKDWLKIADDLQWKEDIDGLLNLYNEAVRLKADPSTLERITAIGNQVRQQKDTPK